MSNEDEPIKDAKTIHRGRGLREEEVLLVAGMRIRNGKRGSGRVKREGDKKLNKDNNFVQVIYLGIAGCERHSNDKKKH